MTTLTHRYNRTKDWNGEGLSVQPRQLSILYVMIPILSVLTTLATGFWGLRADGGAQYGFPTPLEDCRISPSLQYVSSPHELQLELLHTRRSVLRCHRICNRPHLH